MYWEHDSGSSVVSKVLFPVELLSQTSYLYHYCCNCLHCYCSHNLTTTTTPTTITATAVVWLLLSLCRQAVMLIQLKTGGWLRHGTCARALHGVHTVWASQPVLEVLNSFHVWFIYLCPFVKKHRLHSRFAWPFSANQAKKQSRFKTEPSMIIVNEHT